MNDVCVYFIQTYEKKNHIIIIAKLCPWSMWLAVEENSKKNLPFVTIL
jgi:hypothetical protein